MIRRYPLAGYFALTYLITWPFHSLGLFLATQNGLEISNEDNFHTLGNLLRGDLDRSHLPPFVIFLMGQSGPVVAAFAVTGLVYGRVGLRDLLSRTVRWRVPLRWYLTVLLVPLAIVAVSLAFAFITGGFSVGPFEPEVRWAAFLPFLGVMLILTGLAEEPGWRGFALPHLQASNTAWRASWILGIGWGLWHVPFTVYFNRDDPFLLVPAMFGLTLGIVGWTIVNTWIYNATSSVFLMIVLHGWNLAVQSYLVLSQDNFAAHSLYTLLPWALAIYLGRRYGEENLGDRPRPEWSVDGPAVERRDLHIAGSHGSTAPTAELP